MTDQSQTPQLQTPQATFAQTLKHIVKRVLKVGVIGYVLVLTLMVFFENQLIFPAPRYPRGDWQPRGLNYEDVHFESADGTSLHGWYVEHDNPRAYVLFCHGNGEHVAYRARYLHDYSQRFRVSIFAFDYRGYGRSEGKPHEKGVLADGDAAQRWLAERAGIPIDQVVLQGVSLGGGVAVDLAANNGARGLILESTFTSMPDVAARLYWWAPVRLLMRTQMNSKEKIARYDGPLLQAHGTSDSLIPFEIGKQLHEASPSEQKKFIEMPGNDHNDLSTPEFLDAIDVFLGELP